MRTDTERLDWLSEQAAVTFKLHYNGFVGSRSDIERETGGFNGCIDFFSCPSQHLDDMPTLRQAIDRAMEMDLVNKLSNDKR